MLMCKVKFKVDIQGSFTLDCIRSLKKAFLSTVTAYAHKREGTSRGKQFIPSVTLPYNSACGLTVTAKMTFSCIAACSKSSSGLFC